MNKKGRVLFLSPQPFFIPRGTPINVREILMALSEKDYQITLLAYPFGDDITIKNVSIIRSPSIPWIKAIKAGPSFTKIFLDILFLFKAFFLCLTNRFDLIHGIEEGGIIGGILGLSFRRPFIVDVDSSMSQQLEESGFIRSKLVLKWFEKLEAFFMKRAVRVITVCTTLTEDVKRICPTSKITQIEDFPIDDENGNNVKGLDIRELYSISPDEKLILYAGNLEPYQGIDLLIESYALALGSGDLHPAKLIIVGGSPQDIEKYKNLTKSFNITQHVMFTGLVATETMTSILSQANLLVSPRLKGTNTPLKIYGYMNSSKAILATEISSHTQVLDHSTAYLAATNPQAFSLALIEATSEQEVHAKDRESKIINAKLLGDNKFSRTRFRKDIQNVYEEILKNSHTL